MIDSYNQVNDSLNNTGLGIITILNDRLDIILVDIKRLSKYIYNELYMSNYPIIGKDIIKQDGILVYKFRIHYSVWADTAHWFGQVYEHAQRKLMDIFGVTYNIYHWVEATLGSSQNYIASILVDIWKEFSDAAKRYSSFVVDMIGDIKKGLVLQLEILEQHISEYIDNAIVSVIEDIEMIYFGIRSWVRGKVNYIYEWVLEKYSTLETYINSGITYVTDKYYSLEKYVSSGISRLNSFIISKAKEIYENMSSYLKDVYTAIESKVSVVYEWTKEKIAEAATGIKQSYLLLKTWVTEKVESIVGIIIDNYNNAINYVNTTVEGAYNALTQWVGDKISDTYEYILSIKDYLIDKIEYIYDSVKTLINDSIDNLTTLFKEYKEKIQKDIDELIEWLKDPAVLLAWTLDITASKWGEIRTMIQLIVLHAIETEELT